MSVLEDRNVGPQAFGDGRRAWRGRLVRQMRERGNRSVVRLRDRAGCLRRLRRCFLSRCRNRICSSWTTSGLLQLQVPNPGSDNSLSRESDHLSRVIPLEEVDIWPFVSAVQGRLTCSNQEHDSECLGPAVNKLICDGRYDWVKTEDIEV